MDWEIAKSLQRCQACEKPFDPQEEYFSALYDQDNKFVRKDFCPACWDKQDQTTLFSFWRTRCIPEEKKVKKFVDDSVILDFFMRLQGTADPSKKNFRYVLALLLMRKKLLKFDDIKKGEGGEALVLSLPAEGTKFEVYNPQLTEEQIQQVTEEVGQILNVKI
jgi:hypothetical protein